MDKNKYETPKLQIVRFSEIDVMLASGNKGYQSDPFDKNPFEGDAQ